MGMKQWMTFGIKTEGAEKASKDIDGIAASSKKAEESQEGLNESFEQGSGALNNMTGGAIMAFKGVVSGVKKAVLGMRTLKGAMMATGIGALVVVVGSLISYFTKTKKGAEMLQVATAALGAVTGKITDVFSFLGEKMIGVFTNPKKAVLGLWDTIKSYFIDKFNKVIESVGLLGSAFKKLFAGDFKGAFKDAAKGATGLVMELTPLGTVIKATTAIVKGTVKAVKSFVKEVKEAVGAAISLEKRAVALADAQRNLSVEFAQTRETMNELRMIGEDITQEIGVRIAAIEEAGALEIALADKTLALAQEAVDIKRAQNDITESTAEDLQDLADLEIALSNAQIESAGKQRALLMKVNALYAEQEANAVAAAAAEEQRITDIIARQAEIDDIVDAGMARELQKIRDHWIAKRAEAKLQQQVLVGDKDAERIQLQAVTDKHDKIKKDKEDAAAADLKSGKIAALNATLSALSALNAAFAELSVREKEDNSARLVAIENETDVVKKNMLIKANYEILKEQFEQQKKSFERGKKIQIAQALMATYSSAVSSYNALAGIVPIGPVLGGIAAGAAVISGLAQVAMIQKTTFGGSAPPPPKYSVSAAGGGGGGGAAEAASSTAPQLDLSFLGEGTVGTIQAYVISEQVTNQQQADQIVTDQTTL